jgi:hypothetical protein
VAEIIAGTVAIFKGISALKSLGDMFVSAWLEYQDHKDDAATDRLNKRRAALISSMKQPGLTNDERAEIRRAIWELARS